MPSTGAVSVCKRNFCAACSKLLVQAGGLLFRFGQIFKVVVSILVLGLPAACPCVRDGCLGLGQPSFLYFELLLVFDQILLHCQIVELEP